jgi:hypothetical protein
MEVELSGGLGNQLFQYSFGKFMEIKFEIKVDYVNDYENIHKTQHKSLISDFNLKNKIKEKKSIKSKTHLNLIRVHRYSNRKIKLYSVMNLYFLKNYQSKVIGYDKNITQQLRSRFIRGHFQSLIYADVSKESLAVELVINKPSDCYLRLKKEIETDRPIIIHIRRGDYVENSKSIGLLSLEYYNTAIREMLNYLPNSIFWVFSDDEIECEKLLAKLLINPKKRIYPNSSLKESETLLLMSSGAGLILSNSTFSWWAGYLNNKIVMVPNKWFRTMTDPEQLIPENWIKIQSYWTN